MEHKEKGHRRRGRRLEITRFETSPNFRPPGGKYSWRNEGRVCAIFRYFPFLKKRKFKKEGERAARLKGPSRWRESKRVLLESKGRGFGPEDEEPWRRG